MFADFIFVGTPIPICHGRMDYTIEQVCSIAWKISMSYNMSLLFPNKSESVKKNHYISAAKGKFTFLHLGEPFRGNENKTK
jgi:hypothetical protein